MSTLDNLHNDIKGGTEVDKAKNLIENRAGKIYSSLTAVETDALAFFKDNYPLSSWSSFRFSKNKVELIAIVKDGGREHPDYMTNNPVICVLGHCGVSIVDWKGSSSVLKKAYDIAVSLSYPSEPTSDLRRPAE